MSLPLYRQLEYTTALHGSENAVAAPEICGAVAKQAIPGSDHFDASGPYPMAMIAAGSDLIGGLEVLKTSGCVSLVLVPDPLTGPPVAELSPAFSLMRPFKPHLLVEVGSQNYDPSLHHRERIKRGYRRCRVTSIPLHKTLSEWNRLYSHLVIKRGITGVANFSHEYFEFLAAQPELVCFCATVNDVIAGMTLWWCCDGIVYNHLSAFDATGYANSASFALYDAAITHFSGEAVINLGGGAGLGDGAGGLFDFKLGFSNAEVMSYIAGSILDPQVYADLSAERPDTTFFPAYRSPKKANAGRL